MATQRNINSSDINEMELPKIMSSIGHGIKKNDPWKNALVISKLVNPPEFSTGSLLSLNFENTDKWFQKEELNIFNITFNVELEQA